MVDWEKGAEEERQKWEKIVEKKDKLIDKLAMELTTPLHNKEWIINYFSKLIEEEK
jgi:hypothetical protein